MSKKGIFEEERKRRKVEKSEEGGEERQNEKGTNSDGEEKVRVEGY